jgi:hypothetical protein
MPKNSITDQASWPASVSTLRSFGKCYPPPCGTRGTMPTCCAAPEYALAGTKQNIMKTLSHLIVFVLLATAGSALGDEIAGVWVNESSPYYRIELSSSGDYLYGTASHYDSGKFTQEEHAVVCAVENDDPMRFTIDDDTLVDGDGNKWVRREKLLK